MHATGAQQAIDVADTTRPDLVVLEPLLAQYSGIGFLHEFRSYPEWQQIPIVLHTRLSMNVLTRLKDTLKQDLGVTSVLYKPRTTLTQLLRVVNEAGQLA